MKIVELTSYVAAPTCGMLFVQAGHAVYKLKNKDGWTRYRHAWKRLNGDKLLVDNTTLDDADVFITNLPSEKLHEIGMDYETLHGVYSSLVFGHMLAFDDGRPGFDHSAFWAESGLMDTMSVPLTPPYGVGDSVAGLMLYAKLMSARPGEYVCVSLQEAGRFVTEQHKLIGAVYPPVFHSPYGNPEHEDGVWYMNDGKQRVQIRTLEGKVRR